MVSSNKRNVKDTLEFGKTFHQERPGVFLERNITDILINHEKLAPNPNAIDSNGLENLAQGWQYDSETMRKVVESASESLKIEIKELTSGTPHSTPAEHHPARKRQKLLEPVYDIELKVFIKDADNEFEVVFVKKQDATLETAAGKEGKTFKISTLPFYVPKKSLDIRVQNTKSKSNRTATKKTISKDCWISLKFTFATDEDETHFHEVTGGILPVNAQVMTDVLTSPLGNFSNVPLQIYGSGKGKDKKKRPVPLMLVLDLTWRTNLASHFANLNQAANIMRVLPKRAVENGSQPERCDLKYNYISKNNKPKNVCFERPKCLICVDKQPFDDLDRLHFHLKTCHLDLIFKFNKMGKTKGLTKVEVAITLADEAKTRTKVKKRSFGWVRPPQPFSLDEYLEGNEHWADPHTRRDTATKTDANATLFKAVDVPVMQKKKYEVPRAPGNRIYFRSSNKRPLIEGELLSESDDDVDEEWVKAKERSYVHDPRVTQNQKLLMQKLDDHMNNEFLNANAHVGDAICRFTEAHAAWLCENGLAKDFYVKLSELQQDNVISEPIGTQCRDFLGEEAERIDRRTMALHRKRRRRTSYDSDVDSMSSSSVDDTVMVDAPALEETSPTLRPCESALPIDESLSVSRLCTCGKPPNGFRSTIMCKNAFCSRSAGFHLSCVGLEKRVKGWICQECKPQKPDVSNAKQELPADSVDVVTSDSESISRGEESQRLKSEYSGESLSRRVVDRLEIPQQTTKSQPSSGDADNRTTQNGRTYSPVGRSSHARTKSSLSREIKANDGPVSGSQTKIIIDLDDVDKVKKLELTRTEEEPSGIKDPPISSASPQTVTKRNPLRTNGAAPGVYWKTSTNTNSPREVHSDTPTHPPPTIRRESPRGSKPRPTSPSGISEKINPGRHSPFGTPTRLSSRDRRSPASRTRGVGISSSHHP